MNIQEQKKVNLLQSILNCQLFTQSVIQYLQYQDLINLGMLNKQIYKRINQNILISNTIVYNKLYKSSNHPNYDFSNIPAYQQTYFQNIKLALSNPFLNLLEYKIKFTNIRSQLNRNLKYFVRQQTAQAITNQLFKTLNQPSLTLPKLRRENIGTYCNSQLQLHVVDIILNQVQYEDNEYECISQFKLEMFNRQSQILKSIDQIKMKDILLNLRFRGQTIRQYIESKSPFINIIILILVCVQQYLLGLNKILKSLVSIQQNFHLFIEFNRRYKNYRSTILELNQQFGFLFYHFQVIFNMKLGKYRSNFMHQLWKTLMKKWILNLGQFDSINNKYYNYILLLQRQTNIQKIIEKQMKKMQQDCTLAEIPINKSNYFTFIKNSKYASNYKIKHFHQSDSILPLLNQQYQYYQDIFYDYTEYLVDTSINEVTVHSCGTIDHQLGNIYLSCQKFILQENQKFIFHLFRSFRDLLCIDFLLKQEIAFLEQKLKPSTCLKLIKNIEENLKQIEECLTGKKSQNNFSGSQKNVLQNFYQKNQYIKFINNQRNICQDIDPEYKKLYELDCTISIQEIEDIIENQDSIIDQQVQDYISDEQYEQYSMQIEQSNIRKLKNKKFEQLNDGIIKT